MFQRIAIKGFFSFLAVLVKMGEAPIMILLRIVTWLTRLIVPLFVDQSKFERFADISYGVLSSQRLDVLRPRYLPSGQVLPTVFLVHGGGFQFFSKEAHSLIAQNLAGMGHVVFNVEYRLAPENPFPSGLNDVIQAYEWVCREASRFGADPTRIRMVGESAGAGLLSGLMIRLNGLVEDQDAAGIIKPSADLPKPTHAVLHCGYYQVSNPERWDQDPRSTEVSRARIKVIQKNYLGKLKDQAPRLSDPILVFESIDSKFVKNLPKIFVPVGDLDWVYSDSFRLAEALKTAQASVQFKSYPNQGHAFYFKKWGHEPKELWNDIQNFVMDRG